MRLQPSLLVRIPRKQNPILWLYVLISISFSHLQGTNGISLGNLGYQHFNQPKMSAETASFYKRMLPQTCVAFASRKGKQIFSSAMANGGLKSFFPLIQQFSTQTEPSYCGLSTLVLVLNALAVDPQQHWKGPWRWYEESMLNCCLDLEDVKGSGITLRDFQCLAHCQGLSVELHYGEQSTLEDFRSAVQQACMSDTHENNDDVGDDDASTERDEPLGDVLVISYSRKTMGQTGSGHFSPLAAYDPESDSVLILDTARFKYGAHWAKLSLVYEAMKPIDPHTGKSRGYALISFSPQPERQTNTVTTDAILQPVSLLFRSKLTQNSARRTYKEFLESSTTELTWEGACDYWMREDSKLNNVWSILEPLRMPHREEDKVAVQPLRRFLLDLLQSVDQGSPSCCDSGASNTSCMSEKETIYVVYLGSLSAERRREIVMGLDSEASTWTREQLLIEANLIATAISCCKESTF
jgi:glutathione gamma-glutamylcysteinyltransferase